MLDVHNLQSGYGDLKVVWDVSLSVRPGEITVLLGRNGAGKTTTLRAIMGLNRVMGGSVWFEGAALDKVATHDRVVKGISYVQEGKRIFRELSVEQNLLLGGFSRGKKKRELLAELQEIYSLFAILDEKQHLPAASLSGGQQQMLAIGQALMAKPKLLILDEPSQGLAPVIVKEVLDQIHNLKSTGIGILLVEQDVRDSVAIADQVSVIEMGRTALSGAAKDVTYEQIQDAYFGKAA